MNTEHTDNPADDHAADTDQTDTGHADTAADPTSTDRAATGTLRRALRDAARRVAAASALAFEAEGSDRREYRLLRAVADGRVVRGPARHALSRLEREGLVERIEGRSRLTGDGAALLARLQTVAAEAQSNALAGVSDDDLTSTIATLRAISANLADVPVDASRHRFGGGRGHRHAFHAHRFERGAHLRARRGDDVREDFGFDGHAGHAGPGFGGHGYGPGFGGHGDRHEHAGCHGRGYGRRGEHAFERGFHRGFRHGAGHGAGHSAHRDAGHGAEYGADRDVR